MFGKFKNVFKGSSTNSEKEKLLGETTVLLIDKDADFSQDIKLHLEKDVKEVYLAEDGTEALEIFNTYRPDIVISEVAVPLIDGIELSRIFKNISKDLPIILISNFNDFETLQKIVDIKVEKFISKPISNLNTLSEIVEKITLDIKNRTLKEKMECTEIIDPLTGVYNRTKLNDVISLEINKYRRFNADFSLILVNPDNFNEINIKHGHKTGDKVLKDFAKFIHGNIRSIDLFGRWNDNDFMIVLPQTGANGATKLANNIKEKILEKEFAGSIKLSASFGVVTFKKDDDIFSLIKRVEDALKKSKTNGKNRVIFW